MENRPAESTHPQQTRPHISFQVKWAIGCCDKNKSKHCEKFHKRRKYYDARSVSNKKSYWWGEWRGQEQLKSFHQNEIVFFSIDPYQCCLKMFSMTIIRDTVKNFFTYLVHGEREKEKNCPKRGGGTLQMCDSFSRENIVCKGGTPQICNFSLWLEQYVWGQKNTISSPFYRAIQQDCNL